MIWKKIEKIGISFSRIYGKVSYPRNHLGSACDQRQALSSFQINEVRLQEKKTTCFANEEEISPYPIFYTDSDHKTVHFRESFRGLRRTIRQRWDDWTHQKLLIQ